MNKKLISIIFSLFLYTSISFADNRITLMYNIIPDDDSKKNSVIDSKVQKKLNFKLYNNQETIYFNGEEIIVKDNKFELDISNLEGKQEIKFTNDFNEEAIFTYYISDENGFIKDYSIENNATFIRTVDNVKILYTAHDAKKIDFISNLILSMPDKTKVNLIEINLLPSNHPSNASGITVYNKVTLYNISSYTDTQIKNIVFHEIAHTWSYDLMKQKILDYSFTDFSKAIETDDNYVSHYSQGNSSEDFAESISFYLINSDSFTKKYPARAEYIKKIL